MCVYACSKYYSKRVFKCVCPSHDVPTFTLSCTKKIEKKKGVPSTCRTKWGRNRKKENEGDKDPRRDFSAPCMRSARAKALYVTGTMRLDAKRFKKKKRKRKRIDKDVRRWHTHGSQKLEYSWIHGARRLLQYKKSVPRDTSRRFHRALERSAPSCKEKQNKNIYIYIGLALCHPSSLSFHIPHWFSSFWAFMTADEAVVSHLQLRPSHLRSAPLFRMFSVM